MRACNATSLERLIVLQNTVEDLEVFWTKPHSHRQALKKIRLMRLCREELSEIMKQCTQDEKRQVLTSYRRLEAIFTADIGKVNRVPIPNGNTISEESFLNDP